MKFNLFNSVKVEVPQTNYFDLSHDIKFTARLGDLMPICVEEVMPGDKFRLGADLMVRCAPMIAPVMHRMDATIHYFYVPYRLLTDWEKFISPQDPDEPEPVLPFVKMNADTVAGFQKLADYMGIPPWQTGGTETNINALAFLAYNKIWNEYYRDQNLQTNKAYDYHATGEITSGYFSLKQRAWEHDYFTSALPWAQKGAPVEIPINMEDSRVRINPASASTNLAGDAGTVLAGQKVTDNVAIPEGAAFAEGQQNTSLINDLRRAEALQRWLEAIGRGGSRYIEYLKNIWGVNSSDARLQRPEYITGVKAPIVISEVLNTTGLSGELPQGNMSGHGISVTDGGTGGYYCEEWGVIIGIASITAKPGYMDGLPKMFTKFDRFDYPAPQFAHIGEQEVKMQELLAYTSEKDTVFGYLPRYTEYKYHAPYVAGGFRQTALLPWHLNRKFAWEPDGIVPLNGDFISQDAYDATRLFAVNDPDNEQFYCHLVNNIGVNRKLPIYSNPI